MLRVPSGLQILTSLSVPPKTSCPSTFSVTWFILPRRLGAILFALLVAPAIFHTSPWLVLGTWAAQHQDRFLPGDSLVQRLPSGYSYLMSRVLKWNGRDLPDELRSLPAGRYVVEPVDETPVLTTDEEQGLVEALQAIDRGEGESAKEVRRAIGKALKR